MNYNYEACGQLYANSSAMHLGVAEHWLFENNSFDAVRQLMAEMSDDELTAECWDGWELDDRENSLSSNPAPFDKTELVAAFADIRANLDRYDD